LPSLPITRGCIIAAICSRCRSRRNLRIRHRFSTDLPSTSTDRVSQSRQTVPDASHAR
jgi:hypothetical protein